MKEDAERIICIPLPRVPQSNKLIWHFDKNGNYSVKSGYQIALKLKFPEAASSSNKSKTHWGVIWSREISEKIKVFMWKPAKNLLPTTYNLWKKKGYK